MGQGAGMHGDSEEVGCVCLVYLVTLSKPR